MFNKLLEMIKLLPKIEFPERVVEGHINAVKMSYGSLPEDQQEEIVRRRLLCQTCPNMSGNKDGAKQKSFDYCTLCSCPILQKTASFMDNCGALSYNAKHPEDQQPVLWEKYIKK